MDNEALLGRMARLTQYPNKYGYMGEIMEKTMEPTIEGLGVSESTAKFRIWSFSPGYDREAMKCAPAEF